ncbi:hypothetical protein GH975_08830 [Litorivicinus lipolyticus]|uniref:Uncharacterized protein n=1 Tax=Litorivicinus lipolyticus TaxID=418701 RepID=A0A5Q2QI06_9GAMM|nr:hypothetical protein [Litorivicinus lipolyticus]QGG80665.1 hypothetical protein GH975_08830 [Litorivicinus lipolyticus]
MLTDVRRMLGQGQLLIMNTIQANEITQRGTGHGADRATQCSAGGDMGLTCAHG